MGKKWRIAAVVCMLAMILAVPSVFAETPQVISKVNKPKLTSEQTQEIKAIHDQIFELKKQLIEKYKAYDVIDEAKAKKAIDFMTKKQKRLEQNGYVPQYDKKSKWKK